MPATQAPTRFPPFLLQLCIALIYVKFHRILAKKCTPTYYMRLATQAKCHQTIFKMLLSLPVFSVTLS